MSDVDDYNEETERLEKEGYMPWNNHPGYTIQYLDKMLEPHGLKIKTIERDDDDLWFAVEKIK